MLEVSELVKEKKFGVMKICKCGRSRESGVGLGLVKKQWEEERGKEMGGKVMVGVRDGKKGGGGRRGERWGG